MQLSWVLKVPKMNALKFTDGKELNFSLASVSFGFLALCQSLIRPLIGAEGPGGRRMTNVDWAGVCGLLSIITLITVIGYREGHSTL